MRNLSVEIKLDPHPWRDGDPVRLACDLSLTELPRADERIKFSSGFQAEVWYVTHHERTGCPYLTLKNQSIPIADFKDTIRKMLANDWIVV